VEKKMRKSTRYFYELVLGFAVIAVLLFEGCSNSGVNDDIGSENQYFNPSINYGSLTDSRDGKHYRTVRIGDRTWMAENLNYATPVCGSSWCYGNRASYCAIYGRLYDWCAALSSCPAGWRLPSYEDWRDLIQTAGGLEVAGENLKSQTSWNDNGNGTDEFGFSALPSGYSRNDHRTFIGAGWSGFWWSATTLGAWIMGFDYKGVEAHEIGSQAGLSVRCVRD
jgi:uncharacterized protein (TIGR02145 family)